MDEISRKLTLIEAQMSRRRLYAQRLAKSPLLFPAIGLIAGIVLQDSLSDTLDSPLWFWFGLLGLFALSLCIYFIWVREQAMPEIAGPVTLLCFLCLGAIRLIAFETSEPNAIEHFVGDERILSTLRGRIITRPYENHENWCFADFAFTDPSSSFYMKVQEAKTLNGWVRTSGTVRVHIDEPTPNLMVGDVAQIYCWLYRFEGPTNPGQFNVARYLARRNVYIGASVPSRDSIEVYQGTKSGPFSQLRAKLSNAASEALLANIPAEASSRGLLQALLLGNRQDINPRVYEAFRKTGLLHLISLSGMHLGIFVGMIWQLCQFAGLMKRPRAIICIMAIAVFLLVVPPRAPTVRAAIIVWTFCLAVLLRRHPDPLNTLSLAAIILLLIRPTQVFEAGWQLSFTAVVGILLLTKRIEDLLHTSTRNWFHQPNHRTGPMSSVARWLGARTIRLFSAGLAAWAGGAGVLLYHFHTITPLASLWTVLVFPFVVLILTAGFFRIILFFLLPTLSGLLAGLVTTTADLFIGVVKIMAVPDINTILIGHVAISVIIFYYAGAFCALYAPIRRPILKKALCAAIILVFVGYLGTLKWQRTHRDDLILTTLDVGHGQAIVARLPGTKTILFDAGSLHRSNVGGRIIIPFLDYVGIERLNAIVVSHNDIDHINGIPEIVYRRRIDHIYANESFFGQATEGGTAKRLIDSLRQDGHEIERMPQTIQSGPSIVHKLWPLDLETTPETLSDNDKSLVSSITFGQATVLLCSDIEQYAQRRIMALYPDLKANIVVEPHHGSTVTQDEHFLDHLNPDVLIRSCGPPRADRETKIPPKFNPKLIDTSQNGSITICVKIRPNGMVKLSICTWKQRQREGD